MWTRRRGIDLWLKVCKQEEGELQRRSGTSGLAFVDEA